MSEPTKSLWAESVHEECQREWFDFPSQDNEGFQPDRLGFYTGYKLAALSYRKQVTAMQARAEAAERECKEWAFKSEMRDQSDAAYLKRREGLIQKVAELEAERDTLQAEDDEALQTKELEIIALIKERDAYKKAKAENDERFQLEAGQLRERVKELEASPQAEQIGKLEIENSKLRAQVAGLRTALERIAYAGRAYRLSRKIAREALENFGRN